MDIKKAEENISIVKAEYRPGASELFTRYIFVSPILRDDINT